MKKYPYTVSITSNYSVEATSIHQAAKLAKKQFKAGKGYIDTIHVNGWTIQVQASSQKKGD